jgi:hypothetical protein
VLIAWSGSLFPWHREKQSVANASQRPPCTHKGCVPPTPPNPPEPNPPTPPSPFKQFSETTLSGGVAIVQFRFWTLDACNSFGVAGNFKTFDDPSESYPVVLADLQTMSTELGCPDLPPPGRFITVESELFAVPAGGARILYPSDASLVAIEARP